MTLEQIINKLASFQFRIKDAIRFKDNDILGPQILGDLRESMEEMQLLINHYLNYPE